MRQHDLSAVRSRANPRRAADSNADIAVGMKMRLGRVEPHSHPHCVIGKKRTLGSDGRRDGIGGALEDDKEGIALGIDLVSAMGHDRFAKETAVLRANITVRGTMPTRKLRRALDVAEEDSHRPARQTSTHNVRSYAEAGLRRSHRVTWSHGARLRQRCAMTPEGGATPAGARPPARGAHREAWCFQA